MVEFILKSVMPSTPHAQLMETEECKRAHPKHLIETTQDSDDMGPKS